MGQKRPARLEQGRRLGSLRRHFSARNLYLEAPISRSYSSQDLIQLLDSLPEAYLLCDDDPQGRILHPNPVFSVRLADEPQRERLQRAIDQMVEDLSSRRRSPSAALENGIGPPLVREVRTAKGRYVLRGSYLGAQEAGSGSTVLIALELSTVEPLSDQALRQRFGLTPREAEVARLIVAGKSNVAISRTMEISPHTAHHYTERVLLKIGVRTRGEVAAKVLGLTVHSTDNGGAPM